jgi:predicted lipoprotein with Yx(FWY)xxD motif
MKKLGLVWHTIKCECFQLRKVVARSAVSLVLLLLTAVSCKNGESYVAPTIPVGVDVISNATFGKILTDNSGRTLYFFSNDFAGENTCEGGCVDAWPIFYLGNQAIGGNLDKADFAETTTKTGKKQSTYKGWPLYYYAGDANSGDINGDKSGDVWYVAKPDYAIMVANNTSTTGGKYLVAPKGRTLYTFTEDSNNVSVCLDGCKTNWPLFLNSFVDVPSIFSASQLQIITRSDGDQQFAFNGSPLYYYSQDTEKGDTNGQGVDQKWFKLAQDRF